MLASGDVLQQTAAFLTYGYTQTVAWKPMVKAPWNTKSIAAAAMPAPVADAVRFSTWYIRAACTAMTAAIRLIMERNYVQSPVSTTPTTYSRWENLPAASSPRGRSAATV